MIRRTFLSSPLLLKAHSLWKNLSQNLASFMSQEKDSPLAAASAEDVFTLENSNHKLEFDRKTAQLLSLRSKGAPQQEFVISNPGIPVFVIQHLTEAREFRQISSLDAKSVDVQVENRTLCAQFSDLGGMNLSATVKVTMGDDGPQSRWSISIANHAGIAITDLQFPFVIASYHLGGVRGTETILQPLTTGRLVQAPVPENLEPDSPHAWQFRPENFDTHHYPGLVFAQFLSYYNDRAGLYIACEDATGGIKLIKPLHSRAGGIRLGFSHVGDWPSEGQRDLGYDVVMQTFEGDWYDAATIYRDWSRQQHWAATPLHKRTDIPDWLLDSPPHIIIRIQGQTDDGPTEPNREFLPYPKLIPLLEKVSKQIDAPLVGVVMSWERPGPWIYPDSFPPAGGDESLHEFSELARARGWHVGSYCNGTRWVTGHFWSGYDGNEYYASNHGDKTVSRTHDLQPWPENWDRTWRPSFAGCLGVEQTHSMAENLVGRLIDDGLDWIQFLDQNAACSTFPCFAPDHGHPVGPGKWMNAAMQSMLDRFRVIAARKSKESQGKRQLVFSVESPPNEFFMPNFEVCDQRVAPPGHRDHGSLFFPLYTFLYHEFIVMQGGFGVAPTPYHLQMRSAYNLVMGEIPGAILTGDGSLLNRGDTDAWWSRWDSSMGNNDDAVTMLRRAVGMRRGKGREFLLWGRMLKPAEWCDARTVHWESNRQVFDIPPVFHSAWQAPDGRLGVVLANWTSEEQRVNLSDPRLGRGVTETISSGKSTTRSRSVNGGKISLSIPPLSCTLLESELPPKSSG
jgi:hypothetical protein